ncbi:MAG: DNA repair protein RecN [Syntrophorhabdus sp. PtaU1.Bin153]|nr:MAG: DNA repair protein RecN [Syntrophorhabdus sp. PtaU1.Bin153]
MLAFLRVKDFAIINELQVEFGEGFNVITGETGAGKSIIINALSSLMKAKTSADAVRAGADQAEVIGHFFYKDEEFILRRIISVSGKSRAFLNDNPVSASRLAEMGDTLVNIYGQNEFQYLLNKESYIGILDSLLSLDNERSILAEKVQALRRCEAELNGKRKEAEGREKEIALLEFQVEEIDREKLKEGEEEDLKARVKILKDAEKIRGVLHAIGEGLYEGEESAHINFRKSVSLLKPFSSIDVVERLKERIETVSFDIEDIFTRIKDMEKGLFCNPEELQKFEERLFRIYELKSKYGKTYEDIRQYEESANQRLVYLKTLSTDISGLEIRKAVLEDEVKKRADHLSEKRRGGTTPIEKAIVDELSFLSMKGIVFRIGITDKGTIDESGKDDVEFLISTNPGEPLKPLRKIASGGELSRIMLAIKRVIGGDEEKTLIFDEVDAGIGGKVADLVGRRLQDLADTHQVISITHLPQIATYGNHHFLVEKFYEQGTTRTGIRKLSGPERVSELARMLGGATITEKTLQRAEEMIHHAAKGIDQGY